MSNRPLLCWFEDCTRTSLPLVGGKCASLGELINAGVRVPPGRMQHHVRRQHFILETGIPVIFFRSHQQSSGSFPIWTQIQNDANTAKTAVRSWTVNFIMGKATLPDRKKHS